MAQFTIYVPEDIAREVQKRAKAAHMSVSAFMADLARRAIQPTDWQHQLDQLYGSCMIGEIEDLPLQDRDGL